ncbi:hypothetical protein TNCV_2345761 [Trichonephila clavipes]|nr:hypothetical protein TNCV_2345761 [Trichonephila clavipes]
MSFSSDVPCIVELFLVLWGAIFISIVGLLDIVVLDMVLQGRFYDFVKVVFTFLGSEGVILEGMLLNVVGSKPEGMVSADKAKNIESVESGTLLLDLRMMKQIYY